MEPLEIYRNKKKVGTLIKYPLLAKYIINCDIENVEKRIKENPEEVNEFASFIANDEYKNSQITLPETGNIAMLCISCINHLGNEYPIRTGIVKLLLENGAKVNIAFENMINITPLNITRRIVSSLSDFDNIRILLKYGAIFVDLTFGDAVELLSFRIEDEIKKMKEEMKEIREEIKRGFMELKYSPNSGYLDAKNDFELLREKK